MLCKELPNGLRIALPALNAFFRVRFSRGTCVWAGVDNVCLRWAALVPAAAVAQAGTRGSRKNSKPACPGRTVQGKLRENAQSPTSRKHAVVARLSFFNTNLWYQWSKAQVYEHTRDDFIALV